MIIYQWAVAQGGVLTVLTGNGLEVARRMAVKSVDNSTSLTAKEREYSKEHIINQEPDLMQSALLPSSWICFSLEE